MKLDRSEVNKSEVTRVVPSTVSGTSLLGTRFNRTLFKLFHEDQMQVKGKHKESVDLVFVGYMFVPWLASGFANLISCFSELNKSIYWFNYK